MTVRTLDVHGCANGFAVEFAAAGHGASLFYLFKYREKPKIVEMVKERVVTEGRADIAVAALGAEQLVARAAPAKGI